MMLPEAYLRYHMRSRKDYILHKVHPGLSIDGGINGRNEKEVSCLASASLSSGFSTSKSAST